MKLLKILVPLKLNWNTKVADGVIDRIKTRLALVP